MSEGAQMAGSVGNAFVGLTEEDSQHLSEKLKVTTPLQINAVTYTVALITADLESLCLSITKSSEVQAICSRFRVIQEVGFSFKWSFERSTALKTLIVRMNAEGALRTKNTATLTRFVKRDGSSDIMRFSQFLVFVSHLERLQHIAEWNNNGGASKAEQSRVAHDLSPLKSLTAAYYRYIDDQSKVVQPIRLMLSHCTQKITI
ncbi:hypothetical protein T05_11164 [Trichinella murrelli]|uniref:Uncharacterized protein n=1 Tax=Trichinella murrelli TaxID=144512 RepID=A0A0V0TWS0_9BILA|nr:hypothetical protein T05_11164 [Trichinella murrelli]